MIDAAISSSHYEQSSQTMTAHAEGRAEQEHPAMVVLPDTSSRRQQNKKVKELEQTLNIMMEKMNKMEELLKIKD